MIEIDVTVLLYIVSKKQDFSETSLTGADLEVRHSNTGKSVLFYKMKLCFYQKLHL